MTTPSTPQDDKTTLDRLRDESTFVEIPEGLETEVNFWLFSLAWDRESF
jgi:hypothetical protein